MTKKIVQIGDKVTIKVAEDNREWGYSPGKDGTVVEIVGWTPYYQSRFMSYNSKPGIYNNRAWPKVKFPDGKIATIGSYHLVCKDKDFDRLGRREEDYLGPLPETEFYEWDEIECQTEPGFRFITYLNYKWVDDITYYQISPSLDGGISTYVKASELKLVSRGAVYNYCHNLPLGIEGNEEFRLFHKLGHFKEIRNPSNGLYLWNNKEFFLASMNRIIDCPVSTFIPNVGHNSAIKFNDRKLGERARNYYLRNPQ